MKTAFKSSKTSALLKILKTFSCLIILAVFTTSWFSCGPDKPPCIVKCETIKEAPPEAFEYLIFPDESWWEFELLDSNIVDTLTLDYTFKSYTNNQCVDGASEVCKYNYMIVYNHSNITYFGDAPDRWGSREEFSIDNRFGGDIWFVLHSSRTTNIASMGHFFNFPFHLGQNYTDDRQLTDTSAQLTINGQKLSCLLITAKKNQFLHDYRIMKFYLSRGIGIVRFEFQNGDIWQLKSHHINK
jgi:hypothetical protein